VWSCYGELYAQRGFLIDITVSLTWWHVVSYVGPSERLVPICQTTWHHITESHNFNIHCCNNLRSHIVFQVRHESQWRHRDQPLLTTPPHTSDRPHGMDGHRNYKTSCMLNHEWIKGATVPKPELDVLHMDLHTILEHLLVFRAQTWTDLFHWALKDLHLIRVTVRIWQALQLTGTQMLYVHMKLNILWL
jgi:hypothetical protein